MENFMDGDLAGLAGQARNTREFTQTIARMELCASGVRFHPQRLNI
jgi:hypothetical protein